MSLFNLSGTKGINIINITADIKAVFEETTTTFLEKEGRIHRGMKKKFHDTLQEKLVELADAYGLLGDKEFFIEGYEEGRNGYIDVVWEGGDGIQLLLEIDSSPRVKSVKKLLSGASQYKIWLYYGRKSPEKALLNDEEEKICFVHIPITF